MRNFMQRTMFTAILKHISTLKRMPASSEFYKTVFRLNGLDFNGYFEDGKSENT